MKRKITAFVDSDVVISSLISKLGAAYFLINETSLKFFISNISLKELKVVVKKLGLKNEALERLVKKQFYITSLKTDLKKIEEKYKDYVMDINDSHIIAGVVKSKVKFLITYNLRHFNVDKIKRDFDILIMTPARFLQYLRSL
ncbi:hypothetical protein COY29_04040 [Candidatus Woesebacteria bacterium CG_4_10_14_0_2_um_filter_39_14]|uniref:PIN domain-containing protein n=2 Tax=Microgenomates group TaxID=1794810 RepID=A0A2M7XLU1_9BACT|nr:MAG: hypothetical protein COY29_04040 [Candidatus Woesebacteria bacterium CG_4_10_14_0_2_um_filter_39_14]PJA49453.1 MAG: hypothetical protein CO169_01970 [Candidatus Shapirobacteria bacterium CG_4_9_14_3_um_filter_39_13]